MRRNRLIRPADRRASDDDEFESSGRKVLDAPGAPARVSEVEEVLRLAAGISALRERAEMSQRDVAERLGVSRPRIAAIERPSNITIDVLSQYVDAIGGQLEINVPRATAGSRC